MRLKLKFHLKRKILVIIIIILILILILSYRFSIKKEDNEKEKFDINITIENMEFIDKIGQDKYSDIENKYFIFNLTINNTGDAKIHFNPNNITITDGNNKTYFYSVDVSNLSERIEKLILNPKNSDYGLIIFELPLNETPYVLNYKDKHINKDFNINSSDIRENFNKPPIANAGGNLTIYTETHLWEASIKFNSNSSSDPNGNDTIRSFYWDFGDGNLSYEKDSIHTYEVIGIYNVTLIVTDDFGVTDNDTISITVRYPLKFEILNYNVRIDKPYGPYNGNLIVEINISNIGNKNITLNSTAFVLETYEGIYYDCYINVDNDSYIMPSGVSEIWGIGFEIPLDQTPKSLIYKNRIFAMFWE